MSQDIKLEEAFKLLEVANKESDRGAVLVYASFLDELLKRTIAAYLVEQKEVLALTDGFNAPIGTLATRTLMAFALGLVSEREYRELLLIRKIRNDFAHSVETSFGGQSVATRCNLLTFAAEDDGGVHVEPRSQFFTSASALIFNLLGRPHYAAQRRLSFNEWPHLIRQ